MHPALGDRQSQMIDPGWRVRQTDYEFLTSPQAAALLGDEGITVISYSGIQQAWGSTGPLRHGGLGKRPAQRHARARDRSRRRPRFLGS